MEIKELFQLLGQITYSYSRIDFLISSVAFDLGLTESPVTYFAKTKFEKKIDAFNDSIKKQMQDSELLKELDIWIARLQGRRETRNNLLHSIILTDSEDNNELMFSNYRLDKKCKIQSDSNIYTLEDLKKLNQSFVDAHNDGYMLLHKLKDHIGKQKPVNN